VKEKVQGTSNGGDVDTFVHELIASVKDLPVTVGGEKSLVRGKTQPLTMCNKSTQQKIVHDIELAVRFQSKRTWIDGTISLSVKTHCPDARSGKYVSLNGDDSIEFDITPLNQTI
jgi:hypothetical protein